MNPKKDLLWSLWVGREAEPQILNRGPHRLLVLKVPWNFRGLDSVYDLGLRLN